MCFDCPEQEEGADVERWRIKKFLRENLFGEAAELIDELPKPTNQDAETYYEELNG